MEYILASDKNLYIVSNISDGVVNEVINWEGDSIQVLESTFIGVTDYLKNPIVITDYIF